MNVGAPVNGTGKAVGVENTVGSKDTKEMGSELKKSVGRLHLVHVSRNIHRYEVREGTTGRPVAAVRGLVQGSPVHGGPDARIAPRIMAVAEPMRQGLSDSQPMPPQPKVELAFYRKYTEAMLRRYLRVSMEVGRVPSVMGREMFRGNVSHYKSGGLEDGVIFCVDVERCLARLQKHERRILQRIALQGYTLQEAAPSLGLDFRRCHESYGRALDALTELFLAGRLLEPQKCCQDVEML